MSPSACRRPQSPWCANISHRTFICLLISASICFSSFFIAVGAQRTAFVHLFEWKWSDVAAECETHLGPKGFAAVQVSPPNEHALIGDPFRPWWQRYQPTSYAINSRSGDEAAFRDMVLRCQGVGVGIYVDAVINHMAGGTTDYPKVPYSSWDFHQQCGIDYGNRDSIQGCWLLNALPDLDTGSEYVRGKIADYLNYLVDMGVAGFRIDAAKHMAPNDINAIINKVHNLREDLHGAGHRPYVFQEVIFAASEPVQPSDYVFVGDVTEFRYGTHIGRMFRHDTNEMISSLRTFGSSWGMQSSAESVVFTDNHDNQRGHGSGYFNHNGEIGGIVTHFYDGAVYNLANVFMLAWPFGYPKIMSSYHWPRNVQNNKDLNEWYGPPSDGNGNTMTVDCDGEWVCEHRWANIANMVGFRNNANNDWSVDNWWDNGNEQIAFGRGSSGYVVINREDGTLEQWLQTGMAAGDYCNVLTGEFLRNSGQCTGDVVTVNGDGTAFFSVQGMSAAAIHTAARIGEGQRPTTEAPTGGDGANGIKIHYKVGFANPNVYAWRVEADGETAVELRGSWPGTAMAAEREGWYGDSFPNENKVMVIFNDGVSQTEDLSITAGEWWRVDDQWLDADPEATPTTTTTTTTTTTVTSSTSSSSVGVGGIVVHYKEGFQNPNIYAWRVGDGVEELRGGWPGSPMTPEGGRPGWYIDSFPNGDTLHLIFNDVERKTGDLTVTRGEWWYVEDQWLNEDPDDNGDVSTMTTVHYKGWVQPFVYAWLDGVEWPETLRGEWPGSPMTAEANGWYVDTFDESEVQLIFNNNGAEQTEDLRRTSGEWWYTNGEWFSANPESRLLKAMRLNKASQ